LCPRPHEEEGKEGGASPSESGRSGVEKKPDVGGGAKKKLLVKSARGFNRREEKEMPKGEARKRQERRIREKGGGDFPSQKERLRGRGI